MYSLRVFDYKLNADLNKKVFNLDLKIARPLYGNMLVIAWRPSINLLEYHLVHFAGFKKFNTVYNV